MPLLNLCTDLISSQLWWVVYMKFHLEEFSDVAQQARVAAVTSAKKSYAHHHYHARQL
jgi:hypothetical protein